MPGCSMSLIVVRHGAGTHNLPEEDPERLLTWNSDGELDTELTNLGKIQASKVAIRLSETQFHLAISSDLIRAKQTAETILEHNRSKESLQQWKMVRERRFGIFGDKLNLLNALRTVEMGVEDRSLLTWAPPGGESPVDLQNRVSKFLTSLNSEVLKLECVCPTVLIVSHAFWMKELFRLMTRTNNDEYLKNTGIDHYKVTLEKRDDGEIVMSDIDCELQSCSKHLD